MQNTCFGQSFETRPAEVKMPAEKVLELVVILLAENVEVKETVYE